MARGNWLAVKGTGEAWARGFSKVIVVGHIAQMVHVMSQGITVLLSERTLCASALEVQALSGHIVHGSLEVSAAGVEGIGGETRSSHSSTTFQLFTS